MRRGSGERRSPRTLSEERGQSEVLGGVLLIGVVVVGSISIVTFGGIALGDTEDQMQTRNAENAMTQMDAKFAEVALGESAAKTVQLPPDARGQEMTVEEGGWIRMSIYNRSNGSLRQTVFNETLGRVVYERDGTTVAYQGGGVWRKQGNGSVMVSPPEFHYRGQTLTLPVVSVSGDGGGLSGRTTIRKNGTANRLYPDVSEGNTNPLENGRVVVTIRSNYYQAWGTFFETRTAGSPDYDHPNDTVSIDLVVNREERQTVESGVVSGEGADLDLENNAEVDSYNSSEGPYPSSQSENSDIVVADELEISNNGVLRGDAVVGGDVELANNAKITGNLSYSGGLDANGGGGGNGNGNGGGGGGGVSQVDGWTAPNATLSDPESVGWLISDRRDALRNSSNNDNGAEDDIQFDNNDDQIEIDCSGDCEIDDGQYYLDAIEEDDFSQTLTLNNSEGPIELYVNGDVEINDNVEVTNRSNRVSVYVGSERGDDGGNSLTLGANTNVTVPNDDATVFWFYMEPDSDADLENGARLTGVVYGPGDSNNEGTEIDLSNQVTLYGALIGQVDEIDQTMEIHYDEALGEALAINNNDQEYIPIVTFLHVTINRVEIES